MNMKALFAGAAIAATVVGVATANAAINIGDTLDIQYTYPALGSVYADSGNFTYTGPGQTVLSSYITTVILAGNRVEFANDQELIGYFFADSSFNGPILYDLTNGTAFSGWHVLSATAPYTSAYLTDGAVGVNWSGQQYVGGSVVIGAPEPSTWAMLGLGFAAMAFAGYRARRTAAATA